MKLKEFIALYSYGRKDANLGLYDYEIVYDNGAFELYDSVDDMLAAILPLFDKEVTYDERRTCQDVEVDVYVDGRMIFSITSIDYISELEQ